MLARKVQEVSPAAAANRALPSEWELKMETVCASVAESLSPSLPLLKPKGTVTWKGLCK